MLQLLALRHSLASAGARPTPSVLPFAGQAGPGLLAGILGGLGLASVGAALHLRARRKAAEQTAPPDADHSLTGDVSDLPLDEDQHQQ